MVAMATGVAVVAVAVVAVVAVAEVATGDRRRASCDECVGPGSTLVLGYPAGFAAGGIAWAGMDERGKTPPDTGWGRRAAGERRGRKNVPAKGGRGGRTGRGYC